MSHRRHELHGEMLHGAIYGLGLCALLWALWSSRAWMHPQAWPYLGLAALIGSMPARRLGWARGAVHATLALGACLALDGGIAVLTAVPFALGRMRGPRRDATDTLARRFCFRASTAGLCAAAGVACLTIRSTALWPPRDIPRDAILFALGYAGGALVLETASTLGHHFRSGWRPLARRAGLVVTGAALSVPAGAGLAGLYADPSGRLLLLGVPLGVLLYLVGRGHARRASPAPADDRGSARIVEALGVALGRTDRSAAEHVRRVRRLCCRVGVLTGMDTPDLESLDEAAALHEIGRLGLPNATTGASDLYVHPRLETGLLDALTLAPGVRHILECRHQRWDTHGASLTDEGMPTAACVLAVTDRFDMLTAPRPLGRALSPTAALRQLRGEFATHFDPVLVDLVEECALEDPEGEAEAARPAPDPAALDLRRAERELDLADTIGAATHAGHDPRAGLALALASLRSLVHHELCVVFLLADADRSLIARHASGSRRERVLGRKIDVDSSVAGACIRDKRALIRPCARERETAPGRGIARSTLGPDLENLDSTVAAPLVVEGRCVGVLAAYDRTECTYAEADRRTLAVVAGHVADLLSDETGAGRLESDRLTDTSTGLPNARFLRRTLGCRIAAMRDGSEGFGLIAFALPELEPLGASQGMARTRARLSAAARLLALSTEGGELLVRFGPEIFVVLTRAHQPGEIAARLDHSLRTTRSARNIDAAKTEIVGAYACCPQDGNETDLLLDRLDERLGLAMGGRSVLPFRTQSRAS